jgi:hypothetical protein
MPERRSSIHPVCRALNGSATLEPSPAFDGRRQAVLEAAPMAINCLSRAEILLAYLRAKLAERILSTLKHDTRRGAISCSGEG